MKTSRLGIYGRHRILFVVALIAIVAGCASFETSTTTSAVPEIRPGITAGYLQPEALPNSLMLLPPPPVAGSIAFALDEEIDRGYFAFRGTPRWELAAKDANLNFPQAAETFSCALGIPITEQETPHLYVLLRRTHSDAILSTHAAKNHYVRKRPFLLNKEPICTPGQKAKLSKEGSYPSGHSSTGWAWALILSEIAPERADVILARGRAYTESRLVCNVHWHSDVDEGRFIGSAVVARLHADPGFRADLEAAKAEFAAARAEGLKPARDCRSEADVLNLDKPPLQ